MFLRLSSESAGQAESPLGVFPVHSGNLPVEGPQGTSRANRRHQAGQWIHWPADEQPARQQVLAGPAPPRSSPPVLRPSPRSAPVRKRGKGNGVLQYMARPNSGIIRRALGVDLFSERWSPDKVVQEPAVQLGIVNRKQEVVAAHDGAIEVFRHDSETAHLGVNLGNEKLPRPADLLSFVLISAPLTISRRTIPLRVTELDIACSRRYRRLSRTPCGAVQPAQGHNRPTVTHFPALPRPS